MALAIRTTGLTKRYKRVEAVKDLTLRVPEGSLFGFLGPNGAGKTTTIEVLAGIEYPSSGEVRVLGHDLSANPNGPAGEMGVVLGENICPEPTLTAVAYLRYAGGLYGLDRELVDDRARDLFDIVGFNQPHTPTGDLSSGNRRKVELVRALLHEPRLLILDEPTRELDIPSKQAFWEVLENLNEEGITIFLSSHDPLEISRLCTRVAIVADGRLRWTGQAEEMMKDGQDLMQNFSRELTRGPTTFELV